ncbi:MAG TPA: hypothetical protein VE076_11755 [Nitrososphaeraceae archaeon]|nr:hypothetical protein [Nitrososphaeraceae archaeon]
MQIILQPVSFDLYENIVSPLERILSEDFDTSKINIATAALPIKELPLLLVVKQRNQWNQALKLTESRNINTVV